MTVRTLPWAPGSVPLMLAPMQGLTNRGMRGLFARWVRPDVLFTEFVRVRPKAKKVISASDRRDVLDEAEGIPLVVQLIGTATGGVVEAAQILVDLGVRHINLNMGCPYGRMSSHLSGGGMFKDLTGVPELLDELRRLTPGSLSVKTRTGFNDCRQIFDLLPLFEDAGVDFLILHPRTVGQKFNDHADHDVTAEVVAATSMPVIANGDIETAEIAHRVLEQTSAAGLMLGRGATADPLLFERIRGNAPAVPTPEEHAAQIRHYLLGLLDRYRDLFCGDHHVLFKLKASLAYQDTPELMPWVTRLRRARTLESFVALLDGGASDVDLPALRTRGPSFGAFRAT